MAARSLRKNKVAVFPFNNHYLSINHPANIIVAGKEYTYLMAYESSLNELIKSFLQKGGKIDKYYLRDINRSRRTLVHLNGWFSGQNMRSAIMKAFNKE